MFTQSPYSRNFIKIFIVTILIGGILSGCATSDIPLLNQGASEGTSENLSENQQNGESEAEANAFQDEETFILVEEIIVLLLFIASLVGIVARRFRVVPATPKLS